MDILLSLSFEDEVDEDGKEIPSVELDKRRIWRLYELIFKEDSDGNTPLHYAIHYWPKEITFKLLTIGCGCSKKDLESSCLS